MKSFAETGVQPASLQSCGETAAQSTDFTAPTAIISAPLCNGASVTQNTAVTISGQLPMPEVELFPLLRFQQMVEPHGILPVDEITGNVTGCWMLQESLQLK